MAKCTKCGAEIGDGVKFCQTCGNKVEADAAGAEQTKGASINTDELVGNIKKLNDTADSTAEFEGEDIEKNRIMAILAYLSWLVLIPIIAAPKSKFARFHANQGLVLAIVEVAWGIVSGVVLSILGAVLGLIHLGFIVSILSAVCGLVNLLFFVMSIIGIVNVVNGKAKELPVIGKIHLLS